jgi:hypothetical protein
MVVLSAKMVGDSEPELELQVALYKKTVIYASTVAFF